MANKGPHQSPIATDSAIAPGRFPLGSEQSRAAARAMLVARKESETDEEWDKELDLTGLAEHMAVAFQCGAQGVAPMADRSPIHIPPGKENTIQGRLFARINEARARMARFEADVKAGR